MNLKTFLAELKRRKVYSVAVGYAVIGWLLIQIVTQVFPRFEIPNWAQRLVIVTIVLGFPIALVLAWVYDFTRQGIRRTEELEPEATVESAERRLCRKIDRRVAFQRFEPGKGSGLFW